MKLTAFLVLFFQIVHAEPIKQAAIWSDCLESYKQFKSIIFDVAYNKNDPQRHLIFRGNKGGPTRALNIYHNGQFWIAELKIEKDYYDKRDAVVILGGEKFCLNYEFNWVRPDDFLLEVFNEKTCNATFTYNMNLAQAEAKPSVEDTLVSKLKNDVNMGLTCISSNNEEDCNPKQKYEEYQRLIKWNTQACKKIKNTQINNLIADTKKILAKYSSEIAPEMPAAATSNEKTKPNVKVKN